MRVKASMVAYMPRDARNFPSTTSTSRTGLVRRSSIVPCCFSWAISLIVRTGAASNMTNRVELNEALINAWLVLSTSRAKKSAVRPTKIAVTT